MQCRRSRSHCVYLCNVDIAGITVFIYVPVVYDAPRKETIVISNWMHKMNVSMVEHINEWEQ